MRQDLISPYQDGGGLPLSEAEMHWRVFEQKNEILFLDLQMFVCAALLTTDWGRKGGNNRTRKQSRRWRKSREQGWAGRKPGVLSCSIV